MDRRISTTRCPQPHVPFRRSTHTLGSAFPPGYLPRGVGTCSMDQGPRTCVRDVQFGLARSILQVANLLGPLRQGRHQKGARGGWGSWALTKDKVSEAGAHSLTDIWEELQNVLPKHTQSPSATVRVPPLPLPGLLGSWAPLQDDPHPIPHPSSNQYGNPTHPNGCGSVSRRLQLPLTVPTAVPGAG